MIFYGCRFCEKFRVMSAYRKSLKYVHSVVGLNKESVYFFLVTDMGKFQEPVSMLPVISYVFFYSCFSFSNFLFPKVFFHFFSFSFVLPKENKNTRTYFPYHFSFSSITTEASFFACNFSGCWTNVLFYFDERLNVKYRNRRLTSGDTKKMKGTSTAIVAIMNKTVIWLLRPLMVCLSFCCLSKTAHRFMSVMTKTCIKIESWKCRYGDFHRIKTNLKVY